MSENLEKSDFSNETLKSWRSQGLISSQEVAFRVGDLIVAENVVTKARRVIESSLLESSGNKRVLKG